MIKPLEDRIILKPKNTKEEKKTSFGLVLVGENNEEENQAIVVAVGEGRRLNNGTQLPVEVKVGDLVLYNPMAVREVEYDNEKYFVIFSADILAIIEDN
jgi:chaperonin GroES